MSKQRNVKDLDAMTEATEEKFIKFKGNEYPVIQFADLPYEQSLEILLVEETLEKDKTYLDQVKTAMRYVEILVPTMPEAVRNKLSSKQITDLAIFALGAAEAPQKGSEENSVSDS